MQIKSKLTSISCVMLQQKTSRNIIATRLCSVPPEYIGNTPALRITHCEIREKVTIHVAGDNVTTATPIPSAVLVT